MRKIGFCLVLLIAAGLVLLLPAHRLFSAPQIEFALSNAASLVAPSGPGEFLVAKRFDVDDGSHAVPGDFNNDGKLDLIVTFGGRVAMLLGNGDGTFQPPKLSLFGGLVLVAGDFNGDGNLDAVGAGFLVLGDGKGGLGKSKKSISVCDNALVGDFNNDGKLDVASGSGACGNFLNILLGNGDGTFQAILTPIDSRGFGRQNAAADVNADGNLDLLFSDRLSGTVHVLLGSGDGTFHAVLNTSGPPGAASVATADSNQDGKLDLVVGNNTLSTFILLGNGDGTFQTPQPFTTGVAGSNLLLAGDLNSDGKIDVVVADGFGFGFIGTAMSILLGNGDGTLRAPISYNSPVGGSSLALGDFNRDGKLDLVLPGALLLGNNTGKFQGAQTFALGGASNFCSFCASVIATGDFNGDGNRDVVSANGSANSVSVLLGNSDGSFQPRTDMPITGTIASAVAVGDFNQDGKVDLAVANRCNNTACDNTQGSIDIFLGNGNGTFLPPLNISLAGNPNGLMAGDFNRDGKLDLAVTLASRISFRILLGNGNGTFQAPLITKLSANAGVMVAGDLNNDGILDLAIGQQATSVSPSGFVVLLGKGDGAFRLPLPLNQTGVPLGMKARDFNRDGKLDLAVADSGPILVFLGNGDGTFGSGTEVGTDPALSVAVADFNADGNLDLALGTLGIFPGPPGTDVLLGNGDGTFQAAVNYPDSGFASFILASDFNRDKATDIATLRGETLTMLLNTGGTRDTVTSSANPSPAGQPVTFTAKVTASVRIIGRPKPTGSVTFFDASAALATMVLSSGQASFTTSSLSTGKHSITALYSGDSNYNQRTSAVLKETIN